jgi:hypothetical protein
MDRFLIALFAGIVGGAAGALAVHLVAPETEAADAAAAPDAALLREVRDRLSAVEDRLARPTPVLGTRAGADGGAPSGGGEVGPLGGAPGGLPSAEAIEAIAARAAEKALAAHAERAGASAKPEPEGKKRAPLAEVARDLRLTSAQEDDLRRIYAERIDRYLRIVTEPDGDPEALRRELDEAKDDPGKKMGIAMRMLPKYMAKLPEVMTVEADTRSRVAKVLGPETYRRYDGYQVEEEDPYGMGGSFRIDARD